MCIVQGEVDNDKHKLGLASVRMKSMRRFIVMLYRNMLLPEILIELCTESYMMIVN
jgi:hypothetical protein